MVKRFIRLGGVDVPSALPAVTITPLDRAFASIPGLHTLIDPEYRVGMGARNLARQNDVLSNSTASGALTGAFPNGAAAFNCTDTNTAQFVSSVDMNPTQWSLIFAHRITARLEGTGHLVIGPGPQSGNDPVIPRMGFFGPGTSARAWNSGNQTDADPIISYAPPASFVNRAAVSMFTFSGGTIRYFENGVQRASASAAPLTNRYQAGQWVMLRFARGLFGNIGVTSSDLSLPSMAAHRARVTEYLMQKYGVL